MKKFNFDVFDNRIVVGKSKVGRLLCFSLVNETLLIFFATIHVL